MICQSISNSSREYQLFPKIGTLSRDVNLSINELRHRIGDYNQNLYYYVLTPICQIEEGTDAILS